MQKKGLRIILAVAASIVLACAVTVFRNYRGVYLQTILFQLNSPGNETATGVIAQLLFHTVQHLAVIFLVISAIALFRENRGKSPWKHLPVISGMMILCAIFCLAFSIKGVTRTIYNRLHYSTVYEDYYVDPGAVNIVEPEKKRNLIIVYLESMETTYADKSHGGATDINYIPELTRFAKENISFSNTDLPVGGGRSTNGADFTLGALLATSGGVTYNTASYTGVRTENYVNHGDVDFYDRYENIEFMPSMTALGDILSGMGYYNEFICGSTGLFAGRRSYYRTHHYDKVCDIDALEELYPEETATWITKFYSYEDNVVFEAAKDEITRAAASEKPFHIDVLTIETHYSTGYVCESCEQQYHDEYGNILSCADRKVTAFLDWCMQQPWYEDTTIVVLGDHVYMGRNSITDEADKEGYARCCYNCFINSVFDEKTIRATNRDFISVDLFPTILSSIGITAEGDRLGLGTNLAGSRKTLAEEKGYAWLNDQLGMNSKMYRDKFRIKVK